jgi:hypothetical protein
VSQDAVLDLLKLALGVVGALLSLLVGLVAYFLRSFHGQVERIGESVESMAREYASTKTVVDGLKERVNGIAEKHSERISALERTVTGLEHDVTTLRGPKP